MEKAKFGENGPLVTPEQFIQQAGNRYPDEIKPICPACKEPVFPHGVHSPNTTSKFNHYPLPPEADPADDCILAERQKKRFAGMYPSGWDEQHGKILRDTFFTEDNIRLTYGFMFSLCGKGNFPLKTFVQCIMRADSKNIWSYKNIPLWIMPYIFLTFYTYPHDGDGKKVYFYFKKSASQSASELWIQSWKCKLMKVYKDSGNVYKCSNNPCTLNKDIPRKLAGNTSWISQNIISRILELR